VLASIGDKHGKTPGQVVVRWHLDNGLVVIPKSKNAQRLAENLDVLDFTLDADDLAEIATLDQGAGAGVDSDVSGH
jgi:2,5-diketo-D-gluconate reductase A